MKSSKASSFRRPAMMQDGTRSNSKADLMDLVRLRVAQIHGCETGQEHYAAKLRSEGESSARLERLESWPVSMVFTRKERTALALAEQLAKPLPRVAPALEHLLEQAKGQFSRSEIIQLVVAVEAMQDWEHHRETLHA